MAGLGLNNVVRRIKQMRITLRKKMMRAKKHSERTISTKNTAESIWIGEEQDVKMDNNKNKINSDVSKMRCRMKAKFIESPVNTRRHSDIWQVPRQSTPNLERKPLDFKDYFCAGPDFKIYDDFNYLGTPKNNADYKNLEEENTPAPPLPPRNKDNPPPVVRIQRRNLHKTKNFVPVSVL